MSKIVAILTDPTTDGLIVKVPCNLATLNGKPIATMGSQILKNQGGMDAPAEFVSGVRLNNKPLTFVQAKTAGGAVIQSTGCVTACILEPSGGSKKRPEEVVEIEDVSIESDYAYKQVERLAEEVAQSTFSMLLEVFFDKDIPLKAYEQLYKDFSEKKKEKLNPKLKLVNASGFIAAYVWKDRVIEINKSTVIKAKKGDKTANSYLLQGLLEEYGHFLDDILRNEYSSQKGDAVHDEGQVFAYYFTNFNILEDKDIEYAMATVNGDSSALKLDLSDLNEEISKVMGRFEKDYKSNEREYFKAGKVNAKMGEYGHFDLEKKVFGEKSGDQENILDANQLSFLYLGNYMRDMSQCITPSTAMYPPDILSKIENFRGLKFLDPVKPNRESWTLIIEVLAAHHTIQELIGDMPEPMGGPGQGITDPAKPAKNPITEKLEKIAISMGLKAAQLAADYVLFVKNFGGFTKEELGVYAPEQHIDNPLYARAFDEINNDIFCCPSPGQKPEDVDVPLGEKMGLQGIIRNTEGDQETDFCPISNSLGTGKYAKKGVGVPTALSYIEKELNKGVAKYKSGTNEYEKNRGLINIGNAFHVLEDYFAHTNFAEISLIKLGISVYPWVEPANFKQKGYKVEKVEKRQDPGNFISDFPAKKSTESDIWPDVADFFSGKGELVRLEHLRVSYRGMFVFKSTSTDPEFNKKYPTQKRIYNAYFRDIGTIGIRLATDLGLTLNGEAYISALPVVSGFFSSADTVHSLTDAAKKLFEEKEISVKNLMMESGLNDYAKAALTLVDMLIIAWLTDIKLNQKEIDKQGAETGKAKTEILEYYKTFIEVRSIAITILIEMKKKSPLLGLVILFVQKIIDSLYNALMNVIKKVIVSCLEVMEKGIVVGQNIQSYKILSSNPSHSQLAKDDPGHPLHSLAAALAIEALSMQKDNMKKLRLNAPVTANDFIAKMKEAMVHPGLGTWMDATVLQWVNSNVHKIEDLNKEEGFKKRTEDTVDAINRAIDEFEKRKEQVIESYMELKADIRRYIEKLRKSIEDLKAAIARFERMSTRKLKKLQGEMEQAVRDFSNQMNESAEELGRRYDRFQGFMKEKTEEVDKAMEEAWEEFQKLFSVNSDDRFRQYMAGIHQEHKLSEPETNEYEHRLYAYLTETKDPVYKQDGEAINEYLALMDGLDKYNDKYMFEDSKTMLARIKNSESQNSFSTLA